MRKIYPIRVYDNSINPKLIEAITNENRRFSYGWKANTETVEDQGHWNNPLLVQPKMSEIDLTDRLEEENPLIFSMWKYLQEHLIGNQKLSRVYINAYTFGTDGYLHRDDSFFKERGPDSPYAETVIVYLNKEWKANWGGETAIFDDEGEIVKSVLPKHGRILIFDGQKQHASRPLSRLCNVLRQVLVFKTLSTTKDPNNLNFIRERTTNHKHSGRTFFEHLVGTQMELLKRGASIDVANAGLFHSVYGTEFYKFQNNDIDREHIKQRIGERAESLVYAFCTTQNRFEEFTGQFANTQSKFYRDLLLIEYCNLIDQNPTSEKAHKIKQLLSLTL